MTEDYTAFFNATEHGTTALYNAANVIGIFEDRYVEVSGVESVKPTFTCSAAEVTGIAHGSTITINALVYTVKGVQPDGTGVVLLVLQAP